MALLGYGSPVRGPGVDAVLWRGVAAYRAGALIYVAILVGRGYDSYARPQLAVAVLGVMTVWTAVVIAHCLTRPRWMRAFLVVDLALTVALLLSTLAVESPARIEAGAPTITTLWGAGPVLAWAVHGGPWYGLAVAGIVSAATVATRGTVAQQTFESIAVLVLAGTVLGYATRIARRTESLMTRVVQAEAAAAERDRLARRIHDGVLQVLALARRGGDTELARLAGEQEVALRALVSTGQPQLQTGKRDLRELLLPLARSHVSISTPSEPVYLSAHSAEELAAAVAAALHNVERHVGAQAPAWVLLEDEGNAVVVSVRDEGPGVTEEQLAAAEQAGRLGVAQSMRGRVRDLGGSTAVASHPGEGTEVEFRVPR